MSLLLRKACQPLLEDVGLGNYHIGIEGNAKCMQILGECNKPLISIFGITFNRMSPTGAEISFAAELLEAFLATHRAQLTSYAKAAQKFYSTPTPDSKAVSVEVSVSSRRNHELSKSIEMYNYSWHDLPVIYKLNKELTTFTAVNVAGKELTPSKMSTYKHDPKAMKAALAFCKAHVKHQAEKAKLEVLQEALSSCDI